MATDPLFPTNAEWADHIGALRKRADVTCTLPACPACAWGEVQRARRAIAVCDRTMRASREIIRRNYYDGGVR